MLTKEQLIVNISAQYFLQSDLSTYICHLNDTCNKEYCGRSELYEICRN